MFPFHFLLVGMFSDKESADILIFVPLYVHLISLTLFIISFMVSSNLSLNLFA